MIIGLTSAISISKVPETFNLYAQIENVLMPLLVKLMEQDAMG